MTCLLFWGVLSGGKNDLRSVMLQLPEVSGVSQTVVRCLLSRAQVKGGKKKKKKTPHEQNSGVLECTILSLFPSRSLFILFYFVCVEVSQHCRDGLLLLVVITFCRT